MKTTIDQKALLEALTVVSAAIARRSTLPILANVQIVAGATHLVTVTTTNLEVHAKAIIPAEVEQEGACTTNHKELLSLIKPLKNQLLHLSFEDGLLTVSTGQLSAQLATMPSEDYPLRPKATESSLRERQIVTLPIATFRRMVESIAYAAAESQSRPVFTGMSLTLKKDVLRAACADSFRISLMQETIEGAGSWNYSLLIPAKPLHDMLKKFPKCGDITLSNQCSAFSTITCAGIIVHIREIEGNYPNVDVIIPKDRDIITTADVNVAALQRALKNVELIAKDSSNITRLHFNGSIEIRVQRDGMKEPMTVQVIAETTGEEMDAAYNWKYLSEVLAPSAKGSVQFHLISPTHPAKITSSELPGFTGIVMPMHTNR